MRICFLSNKYPGKHNHSDYAFVQQLVDAIASLGNECYVISPYSILHYRKLVSRKDRYNVGKGRVLVIRPWFLSFSLSKRLYRLTEMMRSRAIRKGFQLLPSKPDVIYGHFWQMAYEGFDYARRNKIPLYVATGESNVSKMFNIPSDIRQFRDYLSGVICVSSKNKDESIALGLTVDEKCGVFPNAVNSNLFFKRNKFDCRKQLGLSQNAFIVVFVGWFIDRKGSQRLASALDKLDGVNSIFVGKGDKEPQCKGILFKGGVPHNEVPIYLGAADIFVLPTQHEGCCNAVVEAMACGLPIISSNLPFNWDVLNGTNSILIDPNNVEEISKAIIKLRDDRELRQKLADGALQKAISLTIDKRAEAILRFVEEKQLR